MTEYYSDPSFMEKKTGTSEVRRTSSPSPARLDGETYDKKLGIKRLFKLSRDVYGRSRSDLGSSTSHHWARNSQRKWLFFNFLWRWILTVALCLATVGVFIAYEKKWIMNTNDKHIFNFLVTGFFIGIGVNLTASLSHFAEKASWLLVSIQSLPPELFELAMEADKQTSVLKLAWKATGRWRLRMGCIAWLGLMIAAQIGPAILGLTFEISNPSDVGKNNIAFKWGNASVADLSYIRPKVSNGYQSGARKGTEKYTNIQRASAHAYGESTSNWWDIEIKDFIGDFQNASTKFVNYYVPPPQKDPGFVVNWFFRFYDYSVQDRSVLDPSSNLLSDRYASTRAKCIYQDKSKHWFTFNETESQLIMELAGKNETIYMAGNVHNATTYISDPNPYLDPRQARVFVLWSGVVNDEKMYYVYDCSSYVAPVYNVYIGKPVREEDLQLPNEQAQIVAGAIGWSGASNSKSGFQYQTFSMASRWSSNTLLKPEAMANLYISRFAIGVLNAMNFDGPRRIVQNVRLANGGLILVVKWPHAIGAICAIIAAHLLCLLIADFSLSNVLVRDSGPFATALFLRPLLKHIPLGSGGMLRGEEIAETVGKKHVIYTWEEHGEYVASGTGTDYVEERESDGVRYLRAKASDVPMERRKFDTGNYD